MSIYLLIYSADILIGSKFLGDVSLSGDYSRVILLLMRGID